MLGLLVCAHAAIADDAVTARLARRFAECLSVELFRMSTGESTRARGQNLREKSPPPRAGGRPREALRTLYEGDSEVRHYRNELTGAEQVGKRYDVLGLEATVAVQEGTLLQRIDHPNVTPVSDVAQVSGYDAALNVIELIMPFYERGSLADSFERGERFTVGEAINLMSGALLGVAQLHEIEGVLHRDLKSPNLFLDGDGGLRVGDLGVAVRMDPDGTAEALPNARLNSPPETFVEGRVSRASDLYQLGIVLHELASGPLPYGDPAYLLDPLATRLGKGRRGPINPHLSHAPWTPRHLRTVINRALRLSPGERFQSAKGMSDALARVRYVDWRPVVSEPGRLRWEGRSIHHSDRSFAVEATQRRNGWSLVTSRSVV